MREYYFVLLYIAMAIFLTFSFYSLRVTGSMFSLFFITNHYFNNFHNPSVNKKVYRSQALTCQQYQFTFFYHWVKSLKKNINQSNTPYTYQFLVKYFFSVHVHLVLLVCDRNSYEKSQVFASMCCITFGSAETDRVSVF
jgi:hypothetical protein